jgi:hypothetical protein
VSGKFKRGTVVPGFLHPNEASMCWALSWQELILHDAMHSQRIIREGGTYLGKLAGAGGIGDGRNEIATNFLDHTDGEWLWFIDSDMGFAKDTVDRLVAAASPSARPVLGGLCFALKRIEAAPFHAVRNGVIPTVYDYVELPEKGEVGFSPNPRYGRDQVVKAAGTGAACLLIHRSALETVREKYGDAWFNTATHPTGLRGKPRNFSEDLSFCVRLAACGIPLHVDTRIKTVHHKGGIFLDEELFLAQQAAAAADQASELAAAG